MKKLLWMESGRWNRTTKEFCKELIYRSTTGVNCVSKHDEIPRERDIQEYYCKKTVENRWILVENLPLACSVPGTSLVLVSNKLVGLIYLVGCVTWRGLKWQIKTARATEAKITGPRVCQRTNCKAKASVLDVPFMSPLKKMEQNRVDFPELFPEYDVKKSGLYIHMEHGTKLQELSSLDLGRILLSRKLYADVVLRTRNQMGKERWKVQR